MYEQDIFSYAAEKKHIQKLGNLFGKVAVWIYM